MKRSLQRALLVLVPVALIALAWLPALDAPYQYDDHVTPLKDPASQSLTRWREALPRTLRPLTKLSFACESSLGATTAPARRVLTGALFLLTAGLLALLAHACGLAPLPAVGLASLWAVHPVHAETLIALAGRSVLLSLCLMLLSALCLLRGRFAAALSCALLAVLARETAWPWLAACAGLAVWQRGRDVRHALAALFVASVAGGALVLASSRLRTLLLDSFRDPHALNRLGLQWAALPRGTAMLLFDPSGFTLDIDFSPSGWVRVGYLMAALALYVTAAWLALRRDSSFVLRVVALLWLCIVIPLHSVMPKLDPLTARSPSASSVALLLLAALALAGVLARERRALVVFWVSLCVLVSLLVPATRERAALYRDPIALWRDAAARSRTSTRPLINLGTLLAQNGRLDEARSVLEQAVARDAQSREARERLQAVHVLQETRHLLTEPKPHASGHDQASTLRSRAQPRASTPP